MKTVRILSYNIHKGLSQFNWRSVLEEIKEVIIHSRADIVCLQEIGVNSKALAQEFSTQLEYLADTMWPHYAYGKNSAYTSGHHGNAVLSTWPITQFSNIDLTVSPFEKRGMLHAELQLGDNQFLDVFCTHLNLFGLHRKKQIQLIHSYFQRHNLFEKPVALTGDFNDWTATLDSDICQSLNLQEGFYSCSGKHARTFPAWYPLLPLDRIYFRGIEAVKAQCLTDELTTALSDHLPILCEFRYG